MAGFIRPGNTLRLARRLRYVIDLCAIKSVLLAIRPIHFDDESEALDRPMLKDGGLNQSGTGRSGFCLPGTAGSSGLLVDDSSTIDQSMFSNERRIYQVIQNGAVRTSRA